MEKKLKLALQIIEESEEQKLGQIEYDITEEEITIRSKNLKTIFNYIGLCSILDKIGCFVYIDYEGSTGKCVAKIS